MQPTQYMDAIQSIISKNTRYDVAAYYFLKDALDFTVKKAAEDNNGEHRHVSAKELAEGFSDYAVDNFGPMASTMMSEWGIHQTLDIGNMVFLLIEEGVFGKQESDTLEEFDQVFQLMDVLDSPYAPSKAVSN
ncbi:MAG: Minf_1886 family protein [Akkermansiaceae bacterium]